jgi:hypothetical protein
LQWESRSNSVDSPEVRGFAMTIENKPMHN